MIFFSSLSELTYNPSNYLGRFIAIVASFRLSYDTTISWFLNHDTVGSADLHTVCQVAHGLEWAATMEYLRLFSGYIRLDSRHQILAAAHIFH